jgi:hypothetical protein
MSKGEKKCLKPDLLGKVEPIPVLLEQLDPPEKAKQNEQQKQGKYLKPQRPNLAPESQMPLL